MHNTIKRTFTAFFLLALCISIYLISSPFFLALSIASVLGYTYIFEYYPLIQQWNTSTIVLTLLFFIFPSILLTFWAYNPITHPLLLLTCFTALCADTGSYIVGNLFGKHKLAPTISPHKTWEGFIGGCITTILGFTYVYQIQPLFFCILFGCAGTFSALMGDLYISYIKRTANVKDTGTLLPGHGGLLDRLDSVLMVTLLIYALHSTFL